MAAGINPFALQMQQLQRRQAIADMLQQQGMAPQDTQVVGNIAVRRSPLEALSKLGQTFAGAKIQQSNDQSYQDIAKQMMDAQRGALAGLSGSQPTSASNTSGSTPVTGGLAAPTAPPSSFASTLDAAQNASNYGVDPEVIKAAIADQARTDQMKNDASSGIAPTERGDLIRQEAIRQAFVPGTAGMLTIDPATKRPAFQDLPGMAQSTANVTGLTTAATEANKPHYESDPFHPGRTSVTYATPPALAGMQNSPMGSIGRGAQMPAGGTAADLEGQKVGAKTGQDYAASLNDSANAAIQGKRTLSEMNNLLQGFEPGKGAPVLAGLGSAAVAMGVSPETVTQLTNVNPGDAEAFQKGTAALAGEAAKQVTNRVTQTEFKVFLANNPNWMMTPQGIKRVMDFMGKGFDNQIEQQQQFSKWSRTTSPDRWAIDFPAAYNQQQLSRINAGQTNSAPASLTSTRTRSDTVKATAAQGGPVQWQQGMTADKARAKYPKGTVFSFPDGSQGAL